MKFILKNIFPVWRKSLPEEEELIRRIKKGDTTAFDRIIDENIGKIRSLSLTLTHDINSADDLTQEVFLKAYKNIGAFKNKCKVSTWLYRITINTFLNQKKRDNKHIQNNYIDGSESEIFMKNIGVPKNQLSIMQDKIESALRLLTPKERMVFILRHYEEIPTDDIAFMLAISKNSVKTLLRRAVLKLKDFKAPKTKPTSKGL